MPEEAVKEIKVDRKHRKIGNIAPELADRCFTCGTCAEAVRPPGWSPAGTPGRLSGPSSFGMEQEVIDSKWPWVCTLCGRCQYQCPMGIQLMRTFRACRTARTGTRCPAPSTRGTMMISRGAKPRDSQGRFSVPAGGTGRGDGKTTRSSPPPASTCRWTRKGPTSSLPINSKEPFGEPDDMKFWWKIFYAAKEDWTVSSTNWEGVKLGPVLRDDESMKNRSAGSSRTPDDLNVKRFCTPNEGMPTMQPVRVQKLVPEV